ncbi:chromate transporter [Paenibacillus sp. L3-i20]|uniref:chromate transporter n=1 Tax=Paenibacillus sp. L3-i20 TaxID=2905833 RepID=UPI001EDF5185|nr:chromate transporter [Paenibacillus sp. L3-i20]GKU76105.1 chromate transporter [Paenibacillus sp. L3-i20]
MNAKWKLLWAIFWTFLKMGPLSFGGGYALIPVIEREIVVKRKWLKTEDVADSITVSGSIPGAVAINAATFIGYRIAGFSGAIMALLGIFLPSFFLMIGLSIVYMQIKDNPKIEAAFLSIRATVVALIVYAAIKIGKTAIVDFTTGSIAAITVGLLLLGNGHLHPLWLIALGAVSGVIVVKVRSLFGKKTKIVKEETIYDYMI